MINDFNNDTYKDLVLSGPWYNRQYGEAYVELGGSTGFSHLLLREESMCFGAEPACLAAGDLNGDSYGDIVVAARGAAEMPFLFVFLGDSVVDTICDAKFTGIVSVSRFQEVSTGDINGDGFDDMLVSNVEKEGLNGFPYTYIYYGGEVIDTSMDIKMTDLGHAVDDLNNDGIDEAVFYSRHTIPDTFLTMRLYFGEVGFDTFPDDSMQQPFAMYRDAYYSPEIINAGDLNGDGWPEMVIADPGNKERGAKAGKVWVYSLRQWAVEEMSIPAKTNPDIRICPNPLRSLTTIHFSVRGQGNVTFRLRNCAGELVYEEDLGYKMPGVHVVSLGEGMPSGVYFCSFGVNDAVITRKLVVLR